MRISFIKRLLGKTYEVDCPDGTPRGVYRDIDDIYPLLSKDHLKNLDIAINAAKQLEGKVSVNLVEHVTHIFLQFDETNKNYIVDLRAAYSGYMIDPCNKSDWYTDTMTAIIENQGKLVVYPN